MTDGTVLVLHELSGRRPEATLTSHFTLELRS